MRRKLFLYGAGGQAKVIAGILESNKLIVDGIFDDDSSKWGTCFIKYPIDSFDEYIKKHVAQPLRIIVSLGDNRLRNTIVTKIEKYENIHCESAIHPGAFINERVSVDEGSVIMAGAVINCDTKIGKHAIINTSVSIDHDCMIGEYVHVSPGVHIGGTVKIGDGSWIGLGSSIINNCTIGRNVIVGAGSVVIKDIPDSWVVVGNPARFLKMNEK